jgi:hypothetical protein
MSKELRFVLILFGSLFGIFVIACVAALFVFFHEVKKVAQDTRADKLRIAQRIAAIPPGYEVVSANDMLMTLSVGLESADDTMHIILTTNTMPGANLTSQSSDQMTETIYAKSMQLVTGGNCSKPVAGDSEQFTVNGKTVSLDSFTCPGGRHPIKMAFGHFDGRSGPATLMAFGQPATWDEKGIRAILTSSH